MNHLSTFILAVATAVAVISCSSTSKNKAPESTATFLTDLKQLTFDGRRAGEGYFRNDGRYFIFQSERDPQNPFYQIYLKNLTTGETRRVSPGRGKTTCAWVHPRESKVLFSSTHEDPKLNQKIQEEWAERKAPKSRYSWSFDEAYDIYEAGFDGRKLKNLTRTKGYDAEASYSPDGQWIAFASNRAAYTGAMSEADAKIFARDPSYMMDLYIMRADGSGLRRLTQSPGYDGGPFFSPDGQRLTFRRFTPDGKSAEVFTIGVDGQNERQLTKLGAMSWAPFYHPSGDYVIFGSNLYGHANFELFIVDVEGRKAPVRVTQLEGFDGLPVFTPDGKKLVWTRAEKAGEGQLHEAAWDDAAARQALGLPASKPEPKGLKPEIHVSDAKAWVEYLTQEKFQGRMTGSVAESEYTARLAQSFRDMGLKPVGSDYIQSFTFTSGVEFAPGNQLEINWPGGQLKPELSADWVPFSDSKVGAVEAAAVVFAGYGLAAPADGPTRPAYNSYGSVDVKGKWVMVFTGIPNEITNDQRYHLNRYAKIAHKALVARQNGARGLIVVDDALAQASPMKLKFEGRSSDSGLAVIRVSGAVADQLFTRAGTTRADWTKKLATGATEVLAFKDVQATANVQLRLTTAPARNVLAEIKVPGATSTLVIGAHLDHLGLGDRGTSLAKEPGIHYGADDNASGVAAVMEIAQSLAARIDAGTFTPKQNLIFALWSGEEVGILGSNHFLRQIKNRRIAAYLNLDMVGRLRDRLIVQGVASAKEWRGIFETVAMPPGLNLSMQDDPYVPTDALGFYLKKIPSLSFFTGSHPEYHTPADRPELINYDGIAQIAGLVGEVTAHLAKSPTPLVRYQKVDGRPAPTGSGESRGFRLYLGTIPDYSTEEKNGVPISGASKDSPADKAGLKGGDVIVELGGIKIKTLNDYAYCLQALKANEPIKMRVVRAGREIELDITPVLK